jgi:hypothetical protein
MFSPLHSEIHKRVLNCFSCVQINASPSPGDVFIAYVASYGYHELWVNGRKVGDDVLAPSISDLAKRVLLRAYDITEYMTHGSGDGVDINNNTVGIWLGPGWTMFDSVNPKVSFKTHMLCC